MRPRPHLVILAMLVVAAIALRLPGLGNPPQDAHHVRQSDTASIARIMARDGVDLLHPRIGWAGPSAGTVESELPLYNALVALGFPDEGPVTRAGYAVARSISVLAWLVGGIALWLLLRRRFEGSAAPYLALYAFGPLAVVFSRTIQPDALSVCLLLLALERADAAGGATGRGRAVGALLAGLLLGVAISVKATIAFFAPVVLLLLVTRAGGVGPALASGAGLLAAGLPAAWYWHAHQHLGVDGASFGIVGAGAGKWGGPAIWLDPLTWRGIGGTFVMHTATPLGCAFLVLGLRRVRHEPELRPWVAGLGAAGLCAVIATRGVWLHNYYQLAWVPFASVVVGAGVVEGLRLWRVGGNARRAALVAGVLVLGGPTLLAGKAMIENGRRIDPRIRTIAWTINALVPEDAAVVVVDVHPQSILYAADRTGFHRTELAWPELLRLREAGAEYLSLSAAAGYYDAGLQANLREQRRELARANDWVLFDLRDRAAPPEASGVK